MGFSFIDLINNQQMIYGKINETKENEVKKKATSNADQPLNYDEVLNII